METITITNGAVQLLHQALFQTGWATDTISIYRGGKLGVQLEEYLEGADVPQADIAPIGEEATDEERQAYANAVTAFRAAQSEWLATEASIAVSEADLAVLKTCMEFHVAKGALAPSTHLISVLDALGLAPDEG